MVQEGGLEKQGRAGKTAQQKRCRRQVHLSAWAHLTHTESVSSDLHIGILE